MCDMISFRIIIAMIIVCFSFDMNEGCFLFKYPVLLLLLQTSNVSLHNEQFHGVYRRTQIQTQKSITIN